MSIDEDQLWPPTDIPDKKEINEDWGKLSAVVLSYLRESFGLEAGQKHFFLDSLTARQLNVFITSERDHAMMVLDDLDELDFRPDFGQVESTAAIIEEGDNGSDDREIANDEPEEYAADTRFCIYMALQYRALTEISVGVTDYTYRRIRIHPDAALALIQSIQDDEVRTRLAKTLVFDFMKGVRRDVKEAAAEEEREEWQEAPPDPLPEILLSCEHLQALYTRMLAGENNES